MVIKYKICGTDWLTFPLIIVNFNHFFIQPAPGGENPGVCIALVIRQIEMIPWQAFGCNMPLKGLTACVGKALTNKILF